MAYVSLKEERQRERVRLVKKIYFKGKRGREKLTRRREM